MWDIYSCEGRSERHGVGPRKKETTKHAAYCWRWREVIRCAVSNVLFATCDLCIEGREVAEGW